MEPKKGDWVVVKGRKNVCRITQIGKKHFKAVFLNKNSIRFDLGDRISVSRIKEIIVGSEALKLDKRYKKYFFSGTDFAVFLDESLPKEHF